MFNKRTKVLGSALIACAFLLFALGYVDFRRWQEFRAEWGQQLNFALSMDFHPRYSPFFLPACVLFGVLGLATVTSAIIERRKFRVRRKLD
jgi:hypothetical protein